MRKTPKRAMVDEAGRLYQLRGELEQLRRDRADLDERIARHEERLAEAERRFEASYEQLLAFETGNGDARGAEAEDYLTPGKLPSRVLERMREGPSKIYTAAELQAALGVDDIQQVRTALARLVRRGMVRRAGARGEYTI